MGDDVGRAGAGMSDGRSGSLLRQAYLLTGDAEQAERLTERALAASTSHTRRAGPAGADEHARSELVRMFVADAAPGRHARGPAPVGGRQVAVWEALGGLPARRRAVLVLRYDEGLSDEEIAGRLGSPPRSVLADLEAGLLTLRTALHGESDPGRLVSDALAAAGSRWARWSDGEGVPAVRPVPLIATAPSSLGPWGRRDRWGDGGPWGDAGTWEAPAAAGEPGQSEPFPARGVPLRPAAPLHAESAPQGDGADGAADPPGVLPRRGATVTHGNDSDGGNPGPYGVLPRRGSTTPPANGDPGGTDGIPGPYGALPRRGTTTPPANGDPGGTDGNASPFGALPRRGATTPPANGDPGGTDGIPGPYGALPRRGRTAAHGNDSGNPGPFGALPRRGASAPPAHGGNSSEGGDSRPFGGPGRRRSTDAQHAAAPRAGRIPHGGSPPPVIAAFPLNPDEPHHRRFRTPTVIAAAALTTLVLGAVAVAVPALLNDPASAPGAPTATGGAVGGGETTAASQVPSRTVPKGLLDWPGRGPKAGDGNVLAAATAAWKAKAKGAETPTTDVALLYAGNLDGREVAILQGLDRAGRPRLAQVSGASTDALRLVHSEPLMMADSAVLSILPATGPGGAIRVLVSPEGQAANGLLASDPMSGMPLKKIPLDRDGVSQVLPSPPGVPTCSRVVVMGLPGPLGRTGPRVLESGVVAANMLEGMPMEVEVGSSTLAPADGAIPETQWFADGALLARKLGKKGIVVAALGPRVAPQAMSGSDRRLINSRAYEIRKGRERYIGSVVSLGRKTICITVMPVRSTGTQPPLSAFVLRCPVMGTPAGILHVVGGVDVQSVQVSLAPTPRPAGQQPYGNSVDRPAGSPTTSSFAVLDIVVAGFPCGAGTVQATGGASSAPPTMLPVFTP